MKLYDAKGNEIDRRSATVKMLDDALRSGAKKFAEELYKPNPFLEFCRPRLVDSRGNYLDRTDGMEVKVK